MRSFLLLFLIIALHSCTKKEKVSLIVHNARVYTINDSFSVAEAFAVKDGKILAIGTNRDVLGLYSSDSMLDAKGKPVFPGLIDAHCHFTGYATDMWKCELFGTKSFDEIIDKIRAYAPNAPGAWIYGRGWDQNDWAGKQFPDKRRLDSLFPNRPVFLKRIDGHAALANQFALDLAGIHAGTKIPGGEVELRDGMMTGILIDNAMDELEKHIPLISDSLASRYFLKAQEECFSLGLTSVQDCGISERILNLVDKSHQSGQLKMKIFAILSDSLSYYDSWVKRGPYKTERLHMGGFKLYADGALGSRGACLLNEYSDKKGWKGFMLRDSAYINMIAEKLAASNLQLCTHAIGDSGNRQVLKAYARVLKGKNDRRWRIEHAQVVNPADFHYFTDYSIIPSVQPTHATSDMYWAEERLGRERITNAYAYQQLSKTNGWIPLGTDFPVEYISPFKTFYAAVQRRDAEGIPSGGFQPENALSREQAIRGMTIWAAKAAFEENLKGSLEKGKAADFILLDTDLMTCDPKLILQTKVLATYINGERVY